ncbi:MAG: histidinol-phosphate transaminase [Flavobacteriaceae bacterium]
MIELVRKHLVGMSPYSSARDEFGELGDEIFLDANESPFESDFNRYPDPYQWELKERIGQLKSWQPSQILIGNGSDEILDLLYRAFLEPGKDEILSISPSYGMYKVLADISNIKVNYWKLNSDFQLDMSLLKKALNPNVKMIVLCSPNNPSGNNLNLADMLDLANSFDGIIVVDEAYINFSDQESLSIYIDRYPNIIVVQTLSKAYGMAGLRIGMAYAQKEIIKILNSIKPPYNVNSLSQKVALTELSNSKRISKRINKIKKQRTWLLDELEQIDGIKKVYPSQANFILFEIDKPKYIYDELIKKGVVIRDRSSIEGCEGCLRVSIGKKSQNKAFLTYLKQLLS